MSSNGGFSGPPTLEGIKNINADTDFELHYVGTLLPSVHLSLGKLCPYSGMDY